jgi:UDP-N-acetylmuramate dehydrogenase
MEIKEFVPLAPYTTFKVGGCARYFADVDTTQALSAVIAIAKREQLPTFFFGGGSNILFPDEGVPALVVRIKISGIEWQESGDDIHVVAGAGVNWDMLVEEAVSRGAWGMENLSGIPGTVGGAVVQNIGAYGSELSETFEWAEVFDVATGDIKRITHRDAKFGYRESVWKEESGAGQVILRASFRLASHATPKISYKDLEAYFTAHTNIVPTLHSVREAVLAIRNGKFPDLKVYGTAGSFFKNPVVPNDVAQRLRSKYPNIPAHPFTDTHTKLSAAWIIDHILNMRNFRTGDVGTWRAQALVVVNYGNATANEIKKFTSELSDRSYHECGVRLEPEVVIIA